MTPEAALIATRTAGLFGVTALFGASAFLIFVALDRPTRLFAGKINAAARWGATALLLASLFWPFAQTAVFADTWNAAADPATVASMLTETSAGRGGLVRMGLSLLLFIIAWRGAANRPFSTAALSGALLASVALSGHGGGHDGASALPLAVNHTLHALAGCGWLGAILPLIIAVKLLREAGGQNAQFVLALERFARFGSVMVAGALTTGLINTLATAGLAAFTLRTPYHVLLACKIVCVAGMLLCALLNREVLVPRYRREDAGSSRQLQMSMTIEVALGLAALALVAAFATLDPDG